MSKRKQVHVPIEKIQEQDRFIEAVAENSNRYFAIHGRKPRYMIQTFGCQMNEHDSEKLCAMLDDMGYIKGITAAECDLIIYNTCAVRENAELKVYGNLGQLKFQKRKNPDLKIAVCGCMMQQSHVVDEIKELVANGTKEITLLGQNVDSYGKTLENPVSFAELLRMVNEIEGLERIRFMTSHPKDISDEVIYAMRDCDKVCEFLHLPVQCGSSRLLKKMNRHYTKEYYLEIIEKAKREIPDIAFSTDLMIGFPGETEEDLLDTIDVVQKVRYDLAFTFIYSKRKGTPAANMEDQIPEDVKHERFNRVLSEVNRICGEISDSYVGKTVEVLVEGKSKTDDNRYTGRTRQNKLVNFECDSDEIIGKLVNVKVTESKTFSLNGVIEK